MHLPAIVDAAESSPNAAAAAAQQIRKFLTREWAMKPYVQYNAIMLIRILCDNPGPSFTRNFDKAFVTTVKEVLRNCRDGSTQQILRETLDNLEANKQYQEGLALLIQMWRKEKGQQARLGYGAGSGHGSGSAGPPPQGLGPQNDYMYRHPTHSIQHGGQQRSHSGRRQLPPPIELASRIEEARNTAKILLQLVQSTPAEEMLNNDLIKEFADRCQSAQKSMQGYISCDSPPPDDETMLTLIETNEQLSLASTRYQRSVLNARRALGVSPSPQAETTTNTGPATYFPPQGPPPQQHQQSENLFASNLPPQAPRSPPRQTYDQSAFATRDESFQPPPGPPPSMLARLNSRDSQPQNQYDGMNQSRMPPQQQSSDPFADPVDNERNAAPYAMSSSNYSAVPPHPANRPHSQTFSIDAEPTYAPPPNPPPNRNTADFDDAYARPPSMTVSNADQPGSSVSPSMSSDTFSASSPPRRPGPGAWHNSTITPSYVGRQASAANGLTMHGAGGESDVPEIDGHSEVGRTEGGDGRRDTIATQSSGTASAYNVSPVESRGQQSGGRY